jgi:hypothetical protein
MFFLPYLLKGVSASPTSERDMDLGATKKTMPMEARMAIEPKTRKPGARNSF